MKKVIMTTGTLKSETNENVRKRVTFESQSEDTGPDKSGEFSDKNVYMQVRGNGLLMIRSSSLDENQESAVDIFLNVRNPSSPVTLILPNEHDGFPEVFGDGDIQFTIKGANDFNHTNEFGDSDQECEENNEGDNEREGRVKYTHRRNNSDYLQVWGKGEYSTNDHVDQSVADNDDSSNECEGNDHKNEMLAVENSFSFSSLNGPLTTLYSDMDDTVDSSMAKLNELSKETRQWSTENNENCNNEQKSLDIEPASKKELNVVDDEDEPFPRKFYDSLPIYRRKRNRQLNFRRSVKSSNKDVWKDDRSLKSAIQHSYTYLLDMLDVLELCDHLYETCLLDINMYQKIFELCYEQHHVIYAKRYLLMYLSTRTICHDKFVDALYGSAQYQLIPLFYPGVNI